MKKKLNGLLATSALVLACAPMLRAAVDEQLTLTANGITATIDVSTTGALSVSCSSAGQCGNLATAAANNGANGTIAITLGSFQGYSLDDTAVGWGDNTLPTLENLNQLDADNTSSGGGTLAVTFTDIDYPNVASTLNVGDSVTINSGISTSSSQFTVLTSGINAIPAGSSIYSNTLTGVSASNGAGGVNVSNPNSGTSGTISITEQTVLTFAGEGAIQANITVANVGSVPEPSSVVLLGTLILGLGTLIRKKYSARS